MEALVFEVSFEMHLEYVEPVDCETLCTDEWLD